MSVKERAEGREREAEEGKRKEDEHKQLDH
jgi:hypothetical protein